MRASLEAFEGQYDEVQLGKMVDAELIKAESLDLIENCAESRIPGS